ncbi:multicopper oxidase family protein [Bradyrhizobium sp.]|uniref:multicopper oxidase family protein n=1 Tax=Bradyrhizobium sp. TaxID=376 RepID=UPI002DFC314F|nr:multicopper oxidase domain-containing protein [Bradyrhizobium sp.]
MASPKPLLDRRTLIAGLGAAALSPMLPMSGWAQVRPLTLQAKAEKFTPRWMGPATPVWSLAGPELRANRGDTLDIAFANDLPVRTLPMWRGIDGVPAAEPLLARPAVAAGGRETLQLPIRHAGTNFCDLGLLGDGRAQPCRGLPFIVRESEPVLVDRDQVVLIEEWRVGADGTAIAPGGDPKDTESFHTINGVTSSDLIGIPIRANERLRFRFINASHRAVVAFKVENHEVRVMAIDGQPAEPFLARNGALVLAPGTRIDAFVDVTGSVGTRFLMLLHDGKQEHVFNQLVISDEPPIRSTPLPPAPPLPSNGLPARLDLKNALRVDLTLGGPQTDWVTPVTFAATSAPAFRVKPGRTVVLALTNRAEIPTVFHLHGHHFRLLDRLDDGWKPFWLDTLAIEAGQTQRIAFAAQHVGRWLIESMATAWSAPRLVRWYSVE